MKFHGATWWNTISPGCPWNFNTMLTEPTRQIKTTFLMNMTYMYVIYALFCVEFILYCLKTLSIQYCRITRLFCWITFSKKIRISWNSGLLQYSTGLFTWEYISFVRTQGSVDVMEGHFFFWIFFWGGEIVTQEMGIGENCLGKPAATSYCSIWHTCTSFLFFFCEFFFEIVTMPGTSRKLPWKVGSSFGIGIANAILASDFGFSPSSNSRDGNTPFTFWWNDIFSVPSVVSTCVVCECVCVRESAWKRRRCVCVCVCV